MITVKDDMRTAFLLRLIPHAEYQMYKVGDKIDRSVTFNHIWCWDGFVISAQFNRRHMTQPKQLFGFEDEYEVRELDCEVVSFDELVKFVDSHGGVKGYVDIRMGVKVQFREYDESWEKDKKWNHFPEWTPNEYGRK